MMEADEFRALVERMRHAQKEYFRTRSTSALEQSKKLERDVDAALKDCGQAKMFE